VRLITNSEVNIYFYSPGQILRGSNINRLSTANRENVFTSAISSSMLLTDWEITLDIETVDFSETQGVECLEDEKSYDYCIKSKFLELGNNSMMSPLFLKDRSQRSSDLQGVPIKAVQDYYATLISPDAARSCPKSCSYFQVKFEQKANRDVKNCFLCAALFFLCQLFIDKNRFVSCAVHIIIIPNTLVPSLYLIA
jgi:hypothetical protein